MVDKSNPSIYRIFQKYEGFLLAIAIISTFQLNNEKQWNALLAETDEVDRKIGKNTCGLNLDGIIHYGLNRFEDTQKLRFLLLCILKGSTISKKSISSLWQCDLDGVVSQLKEFQDICYLKDLDQQRFRII